MKQLQLTNGQAVKIGLLLSAGVTVLCLIFSPDSRHVTIFGVNAIIIVVLFGIAGALPGRLLLRNRKGVWFGAGITLLLLFCWLYTIASKVPLD